MNVLLLGSGGREHTMAWKIVKSSKLNKLYIAPGNAGTAKLGQNVDISLTNFEEIKKFVINNSINLLVVGPEAPLVDGIRDYFIADKLLSDVKLIGPSKIGALLEGSKSFAKEFMIKHNIPTANYGSFTKESLNEAINFLNKISPPYVLKADGLAAGKGVLIIDNIEQAKQSLIEMFDGKFGSAGNTVVIEEFLDGIELSVFILTDGSSYKILPEAKDYKRIGEGDTGLNTGGMGAVSPIPFADEPFMKKVEDRIIKPTIAGIIKDKIDYNGFIFFGLMNIEGNPFVIEYNVRMGDPESQVVIPRIKNDFLELLISVADKNLNTKTIELDERTVTTIVLVSKGYPENYEKGKVISNISEKNNTIIFHAGTKIDNDSILTNGGRVMAVSAFGKNIESALNKSYETAKNIKFEGKFFRKDIGFDL